MSESSKTRVGKSPSRVGRCGPKFRTTRRPDSKAGKCVIDLESRKGKGRYCDSSAAGVDVSVENAQSSVLSEEYDRLRGYVEYP